MIKNVVGMYFSPSGATAKITKKITIELTDNMRDSCLDDLSYSFYDMLCLSERHGINTSIDCTDETIVVMGLPVMSGRIPEICKEMLSLMEITATVMRYMSCIRMRMREALT